MYGEWRRRALAAPGLQPREAATRSSSSGLIAKFMVGNQNIVDSHPPWPYIVWKSSRAELFAHPHCIRQGFMTVGAAPTSVFDTDLPTLAYREEETPAEVYPRLQAAQRQAPVAMGPHAPEVLSYHLVRSVLRDTRFQIPPGINLLV